MAVFNSLGSNYSLTFALNSLFGFGGRSSKKTLAQELNDYYGGSVELTNKGRQALELALRCAELGKNAKVGINGFTCYVVYRAVINAGYVPVFVDIAPNQTNFSVQELQSHRDIKAVILQNTLGMPCDMAALKKYCLTNNILIVEDLAHSIGAIYSNGKETGTVGNLVMMSFSQDKQLDAVSGGAAIYRDSRQPFGAKMNNVSVMLGVKNRLYPFWTWLIRTTYPIGSGRFLHKALKMLNLLSSPMSQGLDGIQHMTSEAARLLLPIFHQRQQELQRRREVAAVYQKKLPGRIQLQPIAGSQPSYLRFPVVIKERDELIKYLKQYKIYVGDVWYDAPIAPKKYLNKTVYKAGLCPNAELLCSQILNLPTHINVSKEQAGFISEKVTEWLKSQP